MLQNLRFLPQSEPSASIRSVIAQIMREKTPGIANGTNLWKVLCIYLIRHKVQKVSETLCVRAKVSLGLSVFSAQKHSTTEQCVLSKKLQKFREFSSVSRLSTHIDHKGK